MRSAPLRTAINVFSQTWHLLRRYPVIAVPCALACLSDCVVLAMLALMPFPPFSGVTAPLIAKFWGPSFAHYPANLILLPRLFMYGTLVSSFLFGIILSGMTMAMVYQARQNIRPRMMFGLRKALRRFVQFAAVWSIMFLSVLMLLRVMEYFYPLVPYYIHYFFLGFAATLVVQLLFGFANQTIIIENRSLWPALVRSLSLVRGHPAETSLVMIAPHIAIIPLVYLYLQLPELILRYSPDIIIYVLAVRILILVGIDFAVSSSLTVLFAHYKNRERERVLVT